MSCNETLETCASERCPSLDIKNRIILLTTKGNISHTKFSYNTDDILLLGRESAGVPDAVHLAVNSRIIVPIVTEARSLNIVTSAAMVLGEALRQTNTYPN